MNIESSLSIQGLTRQTAELQALLRMLNLSSGSFSLSIGTCNSPSLRDYLIDQTKLVYPDINVVFVPNGTTDIYSYVRQQADSDLWDALFITGMELSITSSDISHPLLHTLNVSRELWERYFHCPVVIWLPEYAAALMSLEAPDFWRYRSHRFEFVSDYAHVITGFNEDTFENVNSTLDLPVDERQFRIAELEQRLEESRSIPDSRLKQYILMWLNELAYLYRANGQRHDEEQTVHRLNAIYKESQDCDDIAHSMMALGDLYTEWGQQESATWMYNASKEMAERLLAADPAVLMRQIDISHCEDRLGGLCLANGAYDDAEHHYRHALEIRDRILGSEHPYTILSVVELAELRLKVGDVTGAEVEYTNTLSMCERVVGPDNHLTLMAANNLAYLYSRNGNIAGAELLFRRVYETNERMYGPEHRHTLVSENNLATLFTSKGDLTGAESLIRHVLGARERILGVEHPDTLISSSNLAYLLKATGNIDDAEVLYRSVMTTRERVYGLEHPYTLNSMQNLAVLLMTKQNINGAERLFRRLVAARKRVLGPENPDTLNSNSDLAGVLFLKGDYDNAERLYRLNIETQRRVLGVNHPDTMATISSLAFMLDKKNEMAGSGLLLHTVQRAGELITEYDINNLENDLSDTQ